ncbi:MAG: helix-turn-helix transcriptional regulator [Clostridia bacterium]|nr:helix-turn-helix transcriptional regulator [Clostridia bacterium]MBQ7913685.1 helix-turn-helix transcriptional regulator [Clostridia bacterium]
MKNLGETIKTLRLEKKLTQPQLARLVGVSSGMVSIWENNINEPKASYVKALAQVLEVSADYLLGLSDI